MTQCQQDQPPFHSYVNVDLNHPTVHSADEGTPRCSIGTAVFTSGPTCPHPLDPSHTVWICTWSSVYCPRIRTPTREATGADKQLSKLSGHKTNTQQSIVWVHSNGKLSDIEIKETISQSEIDLTNKLVTRNKFNQRWKISIIKLWNIAEYSGVLL